MIEYNMYNIMEYVDTIILYIFFCNVVKLLVN